MPPKTVRFLLLFLLPACTFASVNILSTVHAGTIFSLQNGPGARYLAASQPIDIMPDESVSSLSGNAPQPHIAATCIWFINGHTITRKAIEEQLDMFGRYDDVWNPNFLQHLLIGGDTSDVPTAVDQAADHWLQLLGITYTILSRDVKSLPIPRGPVLISRSEKDLGVFTLHTVYKLFLDEYDAFLFGTISNYNQGGWISTNITHDFGDGTYSQLIPVPSRFLDFTQPKLPLSQMRFGLKDIYDAKGLPTAAGSIAYQMTHPVPSKTAPSVEKLLTLGATMIGKTRTSQFAHGAQPWEFIDVSYSWNPRGDGHLTASASSSGSACAIAAYDWLDFTIGSDTRGSVRKPAALVGAYGIRPSHGSMDLTGVVPLSEEMDTAGLFARHPDLFSTVASHWYMDSPVATHGTWAKFPSKLLYPMEHFPMKNVEAQALVNKFISTLKDHFAIKPVEVNFTSTVSRFFPDGSFPKFQQLSNRLGEYRSWVDVGGPVTDLYVSRYGQLPKFDPIPEKMFDRARNITHQDFTDAITLKRSFAKAMAEHIFRHDDESCSDTIFIYDAATGGLPSYRVEEFNHLSGSVPFVLTAAGGADETAKFSDFFNFLASMGELPEITVPIGQARYYSHLSRKWEYIPVAVEIVARKGCDEILLKLVKYLAEIGIVGPIKTGRSMF